MLLVSCCGDNGALFTVDEKRQRVELVFPYGCSGITKSPKGEIFAYSNELKSIVVFNRDFVMKRKKVVGNDFHGLFYYEDTLYAVDTYNNKLMAYNPFTLDGRVFWDFGENFSGIEHVIPKDLYHINDIHIVNNIVFISLFREESEDRETYIEKGKVYYKYLNEESAILSRVFIDSLTQPHTPTMYGDEFYVCNSRKGTVSRGKLVYEDDELKFDSIKNVELDFGFTRGLLATKDRIYVGVSNSLNRNNNDYRSCIAGIVIVDKRTMDREFVPLLADEVYGILWI